VNEKIKFPVRERNQRS